MAKRNAAFVCQSCGAVFNRWKGKCEACGGWNTIVEETGAAHPMVGPVATRPARAKGRVFPLEGLAGETHDVVVVLNDDNETVASIARTSHRG